MYVLRPTKEKGEELEKSALKDISPNFDETGALGMPIRIQCGEGTQNKEMG